MKEKNTNIRKNKRKICLLCGNSILEPSSSDSEICKDCEGEVAKIRYFRRYAI